MPEPPLLPALLVFRAVLRTRGGHRPPPPRSALQSLLKDAARLGLCCTAVRRPAPPEWWQAHEGWLDGGGI